MNVFYNKSTTGLKSAPTDFDSPTVYLTNGIVYTIDCEGVLYSTPRYVDGSYDTDWVEVDFDEVLAADGTVWVTLLTAIQDCLELDAIYDESGWYFKK